LILLKCNSSQDIQFKELITNSDPKKQLTELTMRGLELNYSSLLLVFDVFPNLNKLYFESDEFTNIEEGAFKKAVNLQELTIAKSSFNSPVTLVKESFHGLENLKVLRLGWVSLDDSSFDLFNCLINLEEFYITVQSVTCVEKFADLPKLKKLTLALESVKTINPKAFDHLSSHLDSLELLSEKELGFFETSLAPSFLKLKNFKHLRLNSSQVGRIEEIFVHNAGNWQLTMLSKTELKKLTVTKFESSHFMTGLTKLTMLLPSKDYSFNQMANLENLKLVVTKPSFIDLNQLKCLSKLKVLGLRYEKISNVFKILVCRFPYIYLQVFFYI
jgi:hypothetical protein